MRPRSILWRTVLACVVVLGSGTPAQADPAPPDQQVFVIGWSEGAQTGDTMNLFGVRLSAAPAGSTLTGSMSSCGRVITQARGGFRDGGGFAFFELLEDPALGELVGPTWEYSLTVTSPGLDPYQLIGSRPVTVVDRPSCEEITNPLVPSWGRKELRRTVAGRTISVAPTTAPGAEVTYTWRFANSYGRLVGTRVGTERSLRLRRAWVGRRVGVVVTVSKPGYQRQKKDIAFPRIRQR